MFEHYKDPERAKRVWKEYQMDIHKYGCYPAAEEILAECDTSDSLDVRLDQLVSISRERFSAPCKQCPIDIDSDGSWSNVVKAYEEG